MSIKWSNFEAVRQMLADTVSLPDTYITISRMLPENRETQIADHPWDDWEEVRHWLKKVVRSLDPGPEGVKLRIRVFQKGGKPVRSIVSLVQGEGKGPPPIVPPSPPPSTSPTVPISLPQAIAMPGFCPNCVATQALLAAKQLQVVDLEARLERTHADKREVETRLADALSKLQAKREENVALRSTVKSLEEFQEGISNAIDQACAEAGDDD
jgi:hypothetical protein